MTKGPSRIIAFILCSKFQKRLKLQYVHVLKKESNCFYLVIPLKTKKFCEIK